EEAPDPVPPGEDRSDRQAVVLRAGQGHAPRSHEPVNLQPAPLKTKLTLTSRHRQADQPYRDTTKLSAIPARQAFLRPTSDTYSRVYSDLSGNVTLIRLLSLSGLRAAAQVMTGCFVMRDWAANATRWVRWREQAMA